MKDDTIIVRNINKIIVDIEIIPTEMWSTLDLEYFISKTKQVLEFSTNGDVTFNDISIIKNKINNLKKPTIIKQYEKIVSKFNKKYIFQDKSPYYLYSGNSSTIEVKIDNNTMKIDIFLSYYLSYSYYLKKSSNNKNKLDSN